MPRTQEEIAAILGVNQSTVSRYMHAQTRPEYDRIAEWLRKGIVDEKHSYGFWYARPATDIRQYLNGGAVRMATAIAVFMAGAFFGFLDGVLFLSGKVIDLQRQVDGGGYAGQSKDRG